MIDDKDMIEINLTTPPTSPTLNKLSAVHEETSRLHDSPPCLTKSFSINDLKDRALQHKIRYQQKYATIGGVKRGDGAKKSDSPNISCLRQMYCPDCNQRLDTESIRFESMLSCCLPLFPLNSVYQCCLRRAIGRKVICNKCGSNMGYWKRS